MLKNCNHNKKKEKLFFIIQNTQTNIAMYTVHCTAFCKRKVDNRSMKNALKFFSCMEMSRHIQLHQSTIAITSELRYIGHVTQPEWRVSRWWVIGRTQFWNSCIRNMDGWAHTQPYGVLDSGHRDRDWVKNYKKLSLDEVCSSGCFNLMET